MIYLREICFSDLNTINKWRNNPELIANLVSPFRYINFETDKNWFEHYMQNRATNVRCVICSTETPDDIIGSIGLLNIDSINRKANFYIMIGDKKNQGKEIGYQATMQILHHAFLNLNLNRVELTVLENNEHAIRLYEKVGFKKEGIQRQSVYKNGKYVCLVLMAILKDEFVKR